MRLQHLQYLVLILLTATPLGLAGCGPAGTGEEVAPSADGEAPRVLSAAALPSFSLSLQPTRAVMLRGTSTSATVNLVRQNGFTGAVDLSLDLNVGFSATFSPSTVSPSLTSSTMTITASPRVVPGTYLVTVRGVSGSMERTAVFQIVVPTPTFLLVLKQPLGGALPEPFPATQNRTTRFLVQVDSLNGFTSPVSVSILGLPAGVFERLEQTPGSNTTTVNLIVENFSVPGTYPISVRGEGGGQVKLATFTLQITSNAIELDADSTGTGQLSSVFGESLPGLALAQQSAVRTVMAVQPLDGSLITAAGNVLSRFSAEGALDRAFVRDAFIGAGRDLINDVFVQEDGRIVTAGVMEVFDASGENVFLVLTANRFTPGGEPDTTFGVNGRFQLETNAAGFALLPLEWGKTLIGGVQAGSVIVVRLTPGGNLDPDFNGDGNTDGRVTVSFGSSVNPNTMDMARDSAGRILVACLVNGKYALARLAPNGALDPTFGVGGRVVTNLTASDSQGPVRIALDSQGRIILVGTSELQVLTRTDFLVARFLPDGGVDTSFGQGGSVSVDFAGSSDGAASLALQPDGRILVGGRAAKSSGNSIDGINDFGLARLSSDGSLDASFGQGGKIMIGLHDHTMPFTGLRFFNESITDLAVQADGSIIASGSVFLATNLGFTAVMRFNP